MFVVLLCIVSISLCTLCFYVSGAEPYSPSKAVVADDEDVPYDPEDVGQFEDEDTLSGPTSEKEAAAKLDKAAWGTVISSQTGAVDSTSSAVSTLAQLAPVSSKPSVNIDHVMEKISASTNPQEISSLMVAALAKAKDSDEQQHILATLTSLVEQQKKLKAEKQLQDECSQSDSAKSSSAVLPSVSATLTATSLADIKAVVAVALTTAASSSSVLSTSAAEGVSVSAGVSSTVGNTESKSKESISRISALTPETENMPLALKALMEELKGNTQMARAVDKRTERDRREWEKKEAVAKEADVEKTEESFPAVKDTQTVISWSKESDSVIPGLGGAEDEENIDGTGTEDREADEAKEKCDVVTSSTDHSQRDKLKSSEIVPVTSSKSDLALSDVDLRHQTGVCGDGVGKDTIAHISASTVLPAQDQDDRVSAHPSLPMPVPPPSVSASYPPTGPFMLPGPPCAMPTRPPLDVTDIDHRRHIHPPPMYQRLGMMPPGYPPRPSVQPPPPGTEVLEDGDVDMRQAAKRAAPPYATTDQPSEKLARSSSASSSHVAPPLPPLPPQPPPPLPPLPSSSGSGDKSRTSELERYNRSGSAHKPHLHEHWRRSQEGSQDCDHRRHHHDQHAHFSLGTHHHPPPSHSHSPPHRYRHSGQDRDERHRRDHFHRDRH